MTEPPQPLQHDPASKQELDEWALALASAGIVSRAQRTSAGWRLLVSATDAARANATLEAYREENRAVPGVIEEAREYGRTSAAFIVGGLLAAFFLVTGPHRMYSAWFRAGRASALRIADGEIWRAATALTLHADVAHVLGNAVTCMIFGTALCRAFGPGVGLWLMLLAGTTGNLATAYWHRTGHSAVGASTAIFGAVGALGAAQAIRWRKRPISGWRAMAPIGGAFAILAFLGASPHSDVLAHLFGFLAGIVLGIGATHLFPRPPGTGVQMVMVAGAAISLLVCWLLALS